MAKRGERLGSQEDGRVHSEHLTVTLRRGQKAKLKEKARAANTTPSGLIQKALESWAFKPRKDPKNNNSGSGR